MKNYRLYCFDGAGRVWVADWLEAASDEEAAAAARKMDVGVKCELWDGHRLVSVIERPRAFATPTLPFRPALMGAD